MRLILFCALACSSLWSNSVTYEFSGGRFGDNLLAYLHAKWISYRYNIPIIYKPFKYSSELQLHDAENSIIQAFEQTIIIKNKKVMEIATAKSTLYVVPFFPESKYELEKLKFFSPFSVNWKDPVFREIITKLLRPKNNLNLINPPKNRVSIAMHVREGGGFDSYTHSTSHFLKFPSMNFYIEALSKMISFFKDKPIYCYIFTDALNPEPIVNKLKASIDNKQDIIFDYRKLNNNHSSNVLEDFFSIMQFSALIRPDSNLSIIPSLIHDYDVLIFPKSCTIKKKQPINYSLNIMIKSS